MKPVESKYRLLVKSLPDAFAYLRLVTEAQDNPVDCIILEMNAAFEKMVGLSGKQLVGKKITEIFPGIEETNPELISTLGRVALTGKDARFEQYCSTTGRWHEITAFSDGIGFFSLVFHDITGQKLARANQETIEKLEEEYNLRMVLLDNIPECIALILKKGTREIVAANKTAREIGAAPGKICYQVCADRDDNCPFCLAQEVWTTSEFRQTEAIHGGKWYHGIWTPLSEELYVHYIFDITERKQAEQALQESEAKYRLLSENINDIIWTTDLSLNYTYVSPTVKQHSGFTVDEIMHYPAYKTLTPSSRKQIYKVIQEELELESAGTADPDRTRTMEVEQYHKNGSTAWVEINASFLRNRDGQPTGFLGITRDITARKQTEQKLADYTRELEDLYAQLDRETEKARHLHERTLPRTAPQLEGISLAAHYQSAQKLGGDFYNAIRAENKLVLYLSDVYGHGMDGAIVSTFVKEAIDSFITLKPEDIGPENILRYLNSQYRKQNYPEEHLLCTFVAVLDLETLELSYSGVGFQESPLVRLDSGEMLRLTSKGLPISPAVPSELLDFSENTLGLTPGTTVFFHTDGLTEQTVDREMYRNRLKEVFYTHSNLPPEALIETVKEDFCHFNNGSLEARDDITMGVLQVDPPDKQVFQLELESSLDELGRLHDYFAPLLSGNHRATAIPGANHFLAGLHELVSNAIEHGNRMDPGKIVRVTVTLAEKYAMAIVKDQGEGFDWQEKLRSSLELKGTSERGRGLIMTSMLCDLFCYNEKGNRALILVKGDSQP